jgi:hypothetical protein
MRFGPCNEFFDRAVGRIRFEPSRQWLRGQVRRTEPPVESPGNQGDRQHRGRAERPGAPAPTGLPGAPPLPVGPDHAAGDFRPRLVGFRRTDQPPGRFALDLAKLIAIDFEIMPGFSRRQRAAASQRQ